MNDICMVEALVASPTKNPLINIAKFEVKNEYSQRETAIRQSSPHERLA